MPVLPHSHPGDLGLRDSLSPFLLGFIAISYQIFWLREFCVHFYGNEMTFGFVLASWLLWGGAGSILASRWKPKNRWLPRLFITAVLLFPVCLILLRFSRYPLRLLPGEITGLGPMLSFSLVLTFFISFPLGVLFVFNVHLNRGNLARVYLLESLGSVFGGLLVYFLGIPFLSNWQGAAVAGGLASFFMFFSFRGENHKLLTVAVLVFLAGFSLLDIPSQKIYWRPFTLSKTKDSPYGKLQVVRTEEQVSLYNNNLLVYSYPDPASAEESVHFAFLQKPNARRALLIGGGSGGGLREALKYPLVEIDYVELDPEIIRLSTKFLPVEEKRFLTDERIRIHYQDGRDFLRKAEGPYDLIILNLPEPATAQLNRFYTWEFFQEAREKLAGDGVFSFRVSSAEHYISPELREFLASLYFTLGRVFPVVEVVPGDTNIFLASKIPLTVDYEELGERIQSLGLRTAFVSPHILFSRLHPHKISHLKEKMESGRQKLNRDMAPVAYFDVLLLWSSQFRGAGKNILAFFSRLSTFWLLDFPLFLFLLLLFLLWIKKKRTNFFLVPLAVMGFTTLTAEIIVVIGFQTYFGYVYSRIALLLTTFMAGLFFGSWLSMKRRKKNFPTLLLIQSGFLLLLFLLKPALKSQPPEIILFLFLLLLGFLNGDLFILANHLYLKEKINYGLGYGLDLLGSFFGALVAASFIIPVVGILPLLTYLFLLNSLCLLFLISGLWKS